MELSKDIRQCINELRDSEKEYPKRGISLEENCNILLHDIHLLLHNKINNMGPYDRRDSGWLDLFNFIEDKMDIIQSHLKDMNDENWEREFIAEAIIKPHFK
jgi:hypothetical protein